MNALLPIIAKLKDNLESVAFLVSKGESEREAHAKIIDSLVILSQIENHIKELGHRNPLSDQAVAYPQSHPQNVKTNSNNKNSETDIEIKKVRRRLPRWFKNPSQYNSTILFSFLELSAQYPQVTVQMLRNKCHLMNDFDGNYNQMKNFGEKNHGKVFEENDGYVTLWEPVKEYILELHQKV